MPASKWGFCFPHSNWNFSGKALHVAKYLEPGVNCDRYIQNTSYEPGGILYILCVGMERKILVTFQLGPENQSDDH